jgi:nucleoside-diphosphate-sugar epimerase
MKFLLLGGGGYLGSVLSELISERRQEVIVYDTFKYWNVQDSRKNVTDIKKLPELLLGTGGVKDSRQNVTYIKDDLTNITNHLDKLQNIDCVLYMASPRFNEVRDDLHITSEILLMDHTLRCVRNVSPNYKLIFFSSCSVYGNTNEVVDENSELIPTTMYSKLKIEGEKQILNSDIKNYLIVRLATLYGVGIIERDDLLINNIVNDVKNNKKIQIYEEDAYRPNLNVKDCAEIIFRLCTENIETKVINVGYNKFNITKKQLIHKVEQSINKKIDVDFVDDGLEFRSYYVNFDRIEKNILNFSPKLLERGIYEIFFKEKLVFGLEEYDSILGCPRPNGSSRTWYLEEEGRLDIPKMWGIWNLMDANSNYKLFGGKTYKDQVEPNFYEEFVDFRQKEKINNETYIYLINVFHPNFFVRNEKIGFKCISEKYIKDIKSGLCKLVLLNGLEGYIGCENNNDLEILNSWIKELDIPSKFVFLLSGNLIIEEIAKNKGIDFKCIPISIFDNWVNYHVMRERTEPIQFNPRDNKFLYLSYNRNVRPHRVHFLSNILSKGLLDIGKVSLNQFQYVQNLPDDHPINQLQKKAPIEIDRGLEYNWANDIAIRDHEDTFISIVTESLTDKDTLFLSEKIWKPISCGHPFMVLGNRGTLKKLKEFGFKTFDKWFDESYDNEEEMSIRSEMIINEIEKFKDKTVDELKQIRDEMLEICEHNRLNYLQMVTYKYTFNGDSMNNHKEIQSLINQIKLGII